jgi:RNA polymerase sigma-70 factor (sigma-E family)
VSTGKYVRVGGKLCRQGSNLWCAPAVYAQAGYRRKGRRLSRGDEEFAEFARASYGGLRHAGYLLTGDRHTAEDAAQTALVRTYAAWSRVRRDDAFAYARRVLVNYLTDGWRRRLREYPTDEMPEQPAGPDLADEVALRQWVSGALATLTARERAVIVMRYLFDVPEAAVARDLGITTGTVKSTSSRALAKLRVRVDTEVPAQAIGGDRP